MAEKKIDLIIKQANVKNYNISIEPTKTIQELKQDLCTEFKTQESLMKLVYKGKILANTNTLEEAGIQNGSIIYLAISNKQETTTQQQAQNSIPQNLSSGGFGLLNQMGFSDRGVNQNQTNQLQQMINSPFYQNMMQQMLSNPQLLRQMAQSNPFLSQLVEQRPEILEQMQSPVFQSMLNDPQILNQAAGMMGRVNPFALGTMSGNSGNLPQPGSKFYFLFDQIFQQDINSQTSQQTSQQPSQQQQQNLSQSYASPPVPNFMQLFQNMTNQMGQYQMQNQNQQQQEQQQQTSQVQATQEEQSLLKDQQNEQQQNQQQQPQQQQNESQHTMFPNFMQILSQMRSQMPQNQQQQQQPNLFQFRPLFPFNFQPNQFPSQQEQTNENLEEKYSKQIKQLEDMGFTDKQANIAALKAANGNVDIAIERLLK